MRRSYTCQPAAHRRPLPRHAAGYDPGSVFDGKLLEERVQTEWGTISLVTAERSLLEVALRDPSNTHFLLISDSDIPLYDPLTFYQQLMHEDKSRTKACRTGPLSEYRWNRFMGVSAAPRRAAPCAAALCLEPTRRPPRSPLTRSPGPAADLRRAPAAVAQEQPVVWADAAARRDCDAGQERVQRVRAAVVLRWCRARHARLQGSMRARQGAAPLRCPPPSRPVPTCACPPVRSFRRFCIAWNNRTKVECYSGEGAHPDAAGRATAACPSPAALPPRRARRACRRAPTTSPPRAPRSSSLHPCAPPACARLPLTRLRLHTCSPPLNPACADEHYFPTLLATLSRENETYCDGNGVASANWTVGGPHPYHYT